MKVLDLFSGCGGMSTGFKMACFDIAVANKLTPKLAILYN